jgi:hypothetical protein
LQEARHEPIQAVLNSIAELRGFRYISGYVIFLKEALMATAQKTPIDAFRKRLRQKGMVRVEIHVHAEDAGLVRSVARALGDPRMAAEARSILRARFATPAKPGLKALLASAPLEGVDLERPRDMGREIDL